jgi:YD repeat-containing protein
LLDVPLALTTRDGTVFRIDAPTGKLESITDRGGNRLVSDASGVRTVSPSGQVLSEVRFERDALGRIVSITDPAGLATPADPDDGKITYTYHAVTGDLIKVTDREGNVVTLGYDNASRPHFLTSITDAQGVSLLNATYGSDGRIAQITDGNNKSALLTYPTVPSELPRGTRIERVVNALTHLTEVVRDKRGNVVRRVQLLETGISGSDNRYIVTVYEYDGLDNQIRTSEPYTVDEEATEITRYTLGIDGTQRRWASQSEFDSRGNLKWTQDALGNRSEFTYDNFGNVLTSKDPLGHVTTNTYDPRSGRLLSTENHLHEVTSYAYDADGNLASVTNAEGKVVSRFTYSNGRLTSVEDVAGKLPTASEGVKRFFVYDAAGNQILSYHHWTDPENPSTIKTIVSRTDYDANGRVIDSSQ